MKHFEVLYTQIDENTDLTPLADLGGRARRTPLKGLDSFVLTYKMIET